MASIKHGIDTIGIKYYGYRIRLLILISNNGRISVSVVDERFSTAYFDVHGAKIPLLYNMIVLFSYNESFDRMWYDNGRFAKLFYGRMKFDFHHRVHLLNRVEVVY